MSKNKSEMALAHAIIFAFSGAGVADVRINTDQIPDDFRARVTVNITSESTYPELEKEFVNTYPEIVFVFNYHLRKPSGKVVQFPDKKPWVFPNQPMLPPDPLAGEPRLETPEDFDKLTETERKLYVELETLLEGHHDSVGEIIGIHLRYIYKRLIMLEKEMGVNHGGNQED